MTMVRRMQLGTQEDDHDHNNSQEKATQNEKRTTMAMAKRSATKNIRR